MIIVSTGCRCRTVWLKRQWRTYEVMKVKYCAPHLCLPTTAPIRLYWTADCVQLIILNCARCWFVRLVERDTNLSLRSVSTYFLALYTFWLPSRCSHDGVFSTWSSLQKVMITESSFEILSFSWSRFAQIFNAETKAYLLRYIFHPPAVLVVVLC